MKISTRRSSSPKQIQFLIIVLSLFQKYLIQLSSAAVILTDSLLLIGESSRKVFLRWFSWFGLTPLTRKSMTDETWSLLRGCVDSLCKMVLFPWSSFWWYSMTFDKFKLSAFWITAANTSTLPKKYWIPNGILQRGCELSYALHTFSRDLRIAINLGEWILHTKDFFFLMRPFHDVNGLMMTLHSAFKSLKRFHIW